MAPRITSPIGLAAMRYRTAVKTGRTAAMQSPASREGTFTRYVAMITVLLVAGTFAAGHVKAQHNPVSLDASITTQVQGVLAKDPFLRRMHINVETQQGVVNLSGFVRSVDDIAKAGKLARGVAGVSAVRNGLRVENRPSRA